MTGGRGNRSPAFAAGMVAGAPFMAAVARRWRRRTALRTLLAAHVVGGLTSSFGVLLGTRVFAALANSGFLAVALTAAAGLVPPEKTGRALAVLLGGTTLACVAGIPGGALLDAAFGWRSAFWVVAALCLPALAGASRVEDTPADLRGELRELRRLPGVLLLGGWVALALTTGAPAMAGSYATAALNVGATAGPVLAGLAKPFWVAAAPAVHALRRRT